MARRHPVQVHPANPHCFLFRDEALKIVTSAEHYGALINGAFNHVAYIEALARAGLNATRLFTFYRELPHHIPEAGRMNTLAPAPEDAILPWERSSTGSNGQGLAADGLPKFDLMRWNSAYFARLHDIVSRCSAAGILCEITLFCNPYDRQRYDLFPCSAASNVNGVGEGLEQPWQFMTLEVPSLVIWQEQFVNKMLRELATYDNVYFEICNEPMIYDDPTAAGAQRVIRWQRHLARILSRLEGGAHDPVHMLAVNAHYRIGDEAPGEAAVASAVMRHDDAPYASDNDMDVLNYHYLSTKAPTQGHHFVRRGNHQAQGGNTAAFVRAREDWRKPIVVDETFSGIVRGLPERQAINRAEAWETLLGGGAGYSNLDWSFTPADPQGLGAVPLDDGRTLDGRPLRQWLNILGKTIEAHDIVHIWPEYDLISDLPQGYAAAASRTSAGRYLVYLVDQRLYQAIACPTASVTLALNLPAGRFRLHALDPRTGKRLRLDDLQSQGAVTLTTPAFAEDLVLLLQQMAN